ncbi:MAG: hypothetical protein ACE5ER_07515 [Nitrospinaceae bacterium]
MKRRRLISLILAGAFILVAGLLVWPLPPAAAMLSETWWLSTFLPGQAAASSECAEASPFSLTFFENLSKGSLAAAFILVFLAILSDKKSVKTVSGALAVLPLIAWGYVHFLVDYDQMRQNIFNLDVRAENTLANIAEAQDRYKSETGAYIKDLSRVKSHLAGAHGMDECVEILSLEVGFEHWSAAAKHRASPDIIRWDSTSGSSLRKG